jgi:hypothetical protein
VDYLTEEEPREIWAILDCSDLRKPYAEEMPDLMEVRALNGDLVPGYRTVSVLGVVPKRRGLLYHHLFSSQEDGFTSQPLELQRAIQTVHQAWQAQEKKSLVTWIMDSEMDDEAVWRTIWEQKEHLVSRLKHEDRWIEVQNEAGEWQEEQITQARARLQLRVQTTTKMKLQLGRQQQPKLQAVRVEVWACPIRVHYDLNVRRPGSAEPVHQDVWLVEVRLPETRMQPWLLLTDWPVTGPAQARRIFAMYRQRWAVEDCFKFTKGALGWEDVRERKPCQMEWCSIQCRNHFMCQSMKLSSAQCHPSRLLQYRRASPIRKMWCTAESSFRTSNSPLLSSRTDAYPSRNCATSRRRRTSVSWVVSIQSEDPSKTARSNALQPHPELSKSKITGTPSGEYKTSPP